MMRKTVTALVLVLGCLAAVALAQQDQPAPGQGGPRWGADGPRGQMMRFRRPPEGAVVLIGADQASLTDNWLRRGSDEATGWTMVDGAAEPTDKADVVSRQSFGDGWYHVEFRCPVDDQGNAVTAGNAGIGIMGRYEVQMFNSPDEEPNATNNTSFFSQTPALRNASRPAGEWQSFDIYFRAPRFDDQGNVTEQARATVLLNGVLVQNNQDFFGPTGIQYGDFPGEVASAPIVLQGNHDPVAMRNLWVLPY